MKQNNYIIKIKNPCQQDWASMSQNELGKFCCTCSKTVVDFTKMTDHEAIQFMKLQQGKVCGRFNNQQLDRPISIIQNSNSNRFYKLVAGLTLIGATNNLIASEKPISNSEIYAVRETQEKPITDVQQEAISPSDSLKNVVRGKVIDKHGKEPISFCNIYIKNTKVGVQSDFDGNFEIVIPDSLLKDNNVLVCTFIGYIDTEIVIKSKDLPIVGEVFSMYPSEILGASCIITVKKWWQFWK